MIGATMSAPTSSIPGEVDLLHPMEIAARNIEHGGVAKRPEKIRKLRNQCSCLLELRPDTGWRLTSPPKALFLIGSERKWPHLSSHFVECRLDRILFPDDVNGVLQLRRTRFETCKSRDIAGVDHRRR